MRLAVVRQSLDGRITPLPQRPSGIRENCVGSLLYLRDQVGEDCEGSEVVGRRYAIKTAVEPGVGAKRGIRLGQVKSSHGMFHQLVLLASRSPELLLVSSGKVAIEGSRCQ